MSAGWLWSLPEIAIFAIRLRECGSLRSSGYGIHGIDEAELLWATDGECLADARIVIATESRERVEQARIDLWRR